MRLLELEVDKWLYVARFLDRTKNKPHVSIFPENSANFDIINLKENVKVHKYEAIFTLSVCHCNTRCLYEK